MACFCKNAFGPLALALPALNVGAAVALPGAGAVMSLAARLQVGLPAWNPDPAWLSLSLPTVRMSAAATATISALAQLRAQALALFGLDLLTGAGAAGFAGLVASLDARMGLTVNAGAWLDLSALLGAIAAVTLALDTGLVGPSVSVDASLAAGLAPWQGFALALQPLSVLISACLQLGVGVGATADLSAALRVMARLSLPALGSGPAMLGLTAALSAVASLQAGLGVNPLVVGLPAIRATLSARLGALLARLSATFGMNASLGLPAMPSLPAPPSLLVNAPTVALAMQAGPVAALGWSVPSVVASVSAGLPVCALALGLQAALGVKANLDAGCPACALA